MREDDFELVEDHLEAIGDGPERGEDALGRLLERLDRSGRRSPGRSDVEADAGVVVECSMDRQDAPASLWPVDSAPAVATVRTLGNATWDRRDGERVLAGSLAHRLAERELRAVAVVGHTDCSVVADAYDRQAGTSEPIASGIEARLEPLVALVEDAIDEGIVESSNPRRSIRRRLVEYNVVRQVSFLADALPSSVTVAGYVHDREGAYSAFPGRHHLVALDGESDARTVRSMLPDGATTTVASLLG